MWVMRRWCSSFWSGELSIETDVYRHVHVRSIDKINDKRPRVRHQLASCSVYLIKEVQHITNLKLDIWVYLNVSKCIYCIYLIHNFYSGIYFVYMLKIYSQESMGWNLPLFLFTYLFSIKILRDFVSFSFI